MTTILKAALDQALNNQVAKLYETLIYNLIDVQHETAISRFNTGLQLAIDAHRKAGLVIDRMTEN